MIKLIIALLLLPILSHGQIMNDSLLRSNIYDAGIELVKFKRIHSTGVTINIIGIGITGIGIATLSNNGNKNAGIATVGGIVSLIGYIIELSSYKHIGKAGIILQGNGIAFPLKRKKGLNDWEQHF
jgi:hypothetical protein